MKKVINETWYELGSCCVVMEQYDDDTWMYFSVQHDGKRAPFSAGRSLDEEGVVVTKEQAMKHLEEVGESLKEHIASQSQSSGEVS